jgi:hypothetical protein
VTGSNRAAAVSGVAIEKCARKSQATPRDTGKNKTVARLFSAGRARSSRTPAGKGVGAGPRVGIVMPLTYIESRASKFPMRLGSNEGDKKHTINI